MVARGTFNVLPVHHCVCIAHSHSFPSWETMTCRIQQVLLGGNGYLLCNLVRSFIQGLYKPSGTQQCQYSSIPLDILHLLWYNCRWINQCFHSLYYFPSDALTTEKLKLGEASEVIEYSIFQNKSGILSSNKILQRHKGGILSLWVRWQHPFWKGVSLYCLKTTSFTRPSCFEVLTVKPAHPFTH